MEKAPNTRLKARSFRQANAFVTQDIRKVLREPLTPTIRNVDQGTEINGSSVECDKEYKEETIVNETKENHERKRSDNFVMNQTIPKIQIEEQNNPIILTSVREISETPRTSLLSPNSRLQRRQRNSQHCAGFTAIQLSQIKLSDTSRTPSRLNTLQPEAVLNTKQDPNEGTSAEDEQIKRLQAAIKLQAWWRGCLTRTWISGLLIEQRLRFGTNAVTPKIPDVNSNCHMQFLNSYPLKHKDRTCSDCPPPWSRVLVHLLCDFLETLKKPHEKSNPCSTIQALYNCEMKRADVLGVGRVEARALKQLRVSEETRKNILETWDLHELRHSSSVSCIFS